MKRKRWLTVALSVAATLAMVVISFIWVKNWECEHLRVEFEHRSLVLSNSIQREVEILLSSLDDQEALFAGSRNVDKDEFHLIAMHSMARTPGLVGMGFAARITPENKAAWVAEAARQGMSPWRIYDLDSVGFPTEPGPRAEQYPLFYVAPDKLSYAAGMTLTHDPLSREAIEYALHSGGTGVTSRLYFSRNAGKRLDSAGNTEVESKMKRPAGHYAFRPMRAASAYHGALPMTWVPADRDSILGLLVAVFRLPEILAKACGPELTAGISMRLIDSLAPPEVRELFSSDLHFLEGAVPGGFSLAGGTSPFKWSRHIQVGGRNWSMEFASTPSEQQKGLRTIQVSGEALLRILDEILDFSKIEAGRLRPQSAPFDLKVVLKEVCDPFRAQAAAERIHVLGRIRPIDYLFLSHCLKTAGASWFEKGYGASRGFGNSKATGNFPNFLSISGSGASLTNSVLSGWICSTSFPFVT